MGEDDARARELLNAAMSLRRYKIRKKWSDIAQDAGMKYQSLHRLRTNPEMRITELAAAGIEDALRWARGTIAAVMAGVMTPEAAAELPISPMDVRWMPDFVPKRLQRTPIDPIASPIEDVNAFLVQVREVEGDEVADELQKSIVRVRALAAQQRQPTATSTDHEES